MEKYSRQALAEGVENASDLVVATDCELYRVLVVHYNRNNQIVVRARYCTAKRSSLSHTQLYSPFKAAQHTRTHTHTRTHINETELGQISSIHVKHYLAHSAQRRHIMFSETETLPEIYVFCR